MKLSPKNQKTNRKYPSFHEYKSKFMITTFTIGMALTPAMLTSCMGAKKPQISETTKVESKTETQKNISQKEDKKDETKVNPSVIKKGKIRKPVVLGGAPRRIQDEKAEDIPCDTDTKDKKKKEEKKDKSKNKDKSADVPKKTEKPGRLMGKRRVMPEKKENK